MKIYSVGSRLYLTFLLGFSVGTSIIGYTMAVDLFTENKINVGFIGIGVAIILSSVILTFALLIGTAEKVFKEHGLDWKKEILEAKL